MARLNVPSLTSLVLSVCLLSSGGCNSVSLSDAHLFPAEEVSLCPAGTALRVSQAQLYSDEFGRWFLIGELFNPSARPVQYALIRVALRTSAGEALQTEQMYAPTGVMANARVPFRLALRLVGIRRESQVSVAACRDDERLSQKPLPERYRALLLEDVKLQPMSAGRAQVVGRVRNIGSMDANKVRVVIGLYDPARQLIGVAEAYVADVAALTAGSAVSFTATTNRVLSSVGPQYLLGVVEGVALSPAEPSKP